MNVARADVATSDPCDLAVAQAGRWLIARCPGPARMLSWAVVGGGARIARTVVWRQVDGIELGVDVDPARWLTQRLSRVGYQPQSRSSDVVGMLTARRVDIFDDVRVDDDGVAARCVATVGLGNAVRVGDRPGPLAPGGALPIIGTINVLCAVSTALDPSAELEAMSIVASARTAAILDAGIASARTGAPATGTGTDCIVLASRLSGPIEAYSGTHTAIGAAIGAAVYQAVLAGAERWCRERMDVVR